MFLDFIFLVFSEIFTWDRQYECAHVPPKGSMSYSFLDALKAEMPNLTKDYNPNHGYEPYWPGGDWVFQTSTLKPNVTTTPVPMVCGEECNYLYTRIKHVCGRKADNTEYERCYTYLGKCTKYYDEYHRGFKTFPTYCKFLAAQCKTNFSTRWIFIHEGRCTYDSGKYFKPVKYHDTNKRMTKYLSQLNKTFVNLSLPNPLRHGDPLSFSPPEDDSLPLPVRQHISNFLQNVLFGNKDEK